MAQNLNIKNHGLHTNVKMLGKTIEKQSGCINHLEEMSLKVTCMRKKNYIRKN